MMWLFMPFWIIHLVTTLHLFLHFSPSDFQQFLTLVCNTIGDQGGSSVGWSLPPKEIVDTMSYSTSTSYGPWPSSCEASRIKDGRRSLTIEWPHSQEITPRPGQYSAMFGVPQREQRITLYEDGTVWMYLSITSGRVRNRYNQQYYVGYYSLTRSATTSLSPSTIDGGSSSGMEGGEWLLTMDLYTMVFSYSDRRTCVPDHGQTYNPVLSPMIMLRGEPYLQLSTHLSHSLLTDPKYMDPRLLDAFILPKGFLASGRGTLEAHNALMKALSMNHESIEKRQYAVSFGATIPESTWIANICRLPSVHPVINGHLRHLNRIPHVHGNNGGNSDNNDDSENDDRKQTPTFPKAATMVDGMSVGHDIASLSTLLPSIVIEQRQHYPLAPPRRIWDNNMMLSLVTPFYIRLLFLLTLHIICMPLFYLHIRQSIVKLREVRPMEDSISYSS
jgi:hypothetical protein